MTNNNKVAIIDYKLCNLFSVVNACKYVGLEPVVTSKHDEIMSCGGAILPGVGAFGKAITKIREENLDRTINDFVQSCRPFMGVCLGLQLLFDKSEEFGDFEGLGIIPGNVKKIPASHGKVPQIGWNRLEVSTDNYSGLATYSALEGEFMYFIHSYYVEPENVQDVLTYSEYGGLRYCSSILRDNISAFQFHPEKSGEAGIQIYTQFKKAITEEAK
ncbi:imidazole glycerol phosphate synthase subunit HisH [Pseudomonadales bacterium]|nr:imidazole glycerol phosphate synthase subunit HisH [Pseudomonadales bacterium]